MRDEKTQLNTIKRQLETPPLVDKNKTAPLCRNCMYHHPEFKYRKCLFSSCPFGKSEKCVFRTRPLSIDSPAKRPTGRPKAVNSDA